MDNVPASETEATRTRSPTSIPNGNVIDPVIENAFLEIEGQSALDRRDYGLYTVGVGYNWNINNHFYLTGKASIPFSNTANSYSVDDNSLSNGFIGSLKLGYSF